MELGNRIKEYRKDLDISQEQLAEKIYVSRQTISNWENNKSYPDIHSLLRLSEVFKASLDILIKGDIEIMREKIKEEDIKRYQRESLPFTILFIVSIVSFPILFVLMDLYAFWIWLPFAFLTLYKALKVEKLKKEFDIQTIKEIVAFEEGKSLDEIEKAQEIGKRPYQKIFLALISALVTFVFGILVIKLLENFPI